ncbi:MAG TPA: hypothetical protein VLI70_03430, partial [Micrococcaceae bacterium]|nr:hypothetical protein [Micrococcaceae bacterium]
AEFAASFAGTAVMDANDLGVVVLGHDTGLAKDVVEGIFRDNPQGQTTETTPMSMVFRQAF